MIDNLIVIYVVGVFLTPVGQVIVDHLLDDHTKVTQWFSLLSALLWPIFWGGFALVATLAVIRVLTEAGVEYLQEKFSR